jgi:hypothetical protein
VGGSVDKSTPSQFLSAALCVAAMLLSACGSQSRKDAEKVLARHFQALATNGYDTALADYGAPMFEKISREEFGKMLAGFGPYRSHVLRGGRVFKDASGTTVSLECNVVYAKSSATEVFFIFKGLTNSDYKIMNHAVVPQ